MFPPFIKGDGGGLGSVFQRAKVLQKILNLFFTSSGVFNLKSEIGFAKGVKDGISRQFALYRES